MRKSVLLVAAMLLALMAFGQVAFAADGDVDRDGHVDAALGGDDCDDTNPDVHPGATEVPGNGVDDDCDGVDALDDDNDGFISDATGGDDCDDTNPDVHPGATEVPGNGVDDDCDGDIDERLDPDDDGDGVPTSRDCDDTDPDVHPGAREVPGNGVDEDCDGVDALDDDNDGFISDATGGNDCDDGDDTVYPGAPALRDGKDNDCDGTLDDQGEYLHVMGVPGEGVADAPGLTRSNSHRHRGHVTILK